MNRILIAMTAPVVLLGCAEKAGVVDTGGSAVDTTPSTPVMWYADADGDGFGSIVVFEQAVTQPVGYVADNTDCDDADHMQHPGAEERCNREDDDCDTLVDEDAVDVLTWYADSDQDGYGDPETPVDACEAPANYITDSTDCDDRDHSQYPGAEESCNQEDDDCDGSVDEDPVDPTAWFEDADGDGYGNADAMIASCTQPVGTVSDDMDCDDNDPEIHPGVEDLRDEIDQDCDGADGFVFYEDFESHAVGDYIGVESIFFATWTTGSEGGSEDVTVVDEESHPAGGKALRFDEDDGDDLVLTLGPSSGAWVVSWFMFLDTGAYFNLQGTNAPWGDWQAELYFDENGAASASYSGTLVSLNTQIAVQDWVFVEYYIDLDMGTQELYIDGVLLHRDGFIGTVLGGIDFYPTTLSSAQTTSTVFFIDDVAFEAVK